MRADQPSRSTELPATGDGQGNAAAGGPPRVLEVLLKKAAVDAAFREALVARRGAVAREHGLPITDEESRMLDSVPEPQLRLMIDRTPVAPKERLDLNTGCLLGLLVSGLLGAIAIPTEPFRQARGHTADVPRLCHSRLKMVQYAIRQYNERIIEPTLRITEITRGNASETYRRLIDSKVTQVSRESDVHCPFCGEYYLGRDLDRGGRLVCKIHDLDRF